MGKFTNIALCVVFVTICWSSTFVNGEMAQLVFTDINFTGNWDYLQMEIESENKTYFLGEFLVLNYMSCDFLGYNATLSNCKDSKYEDCSVYESQTRIFCQNARNKSAPFDYNIGIYFAYPACDIQSLDTLKCDYYTEIFKETETDIPAKMLDTGEYWTRQFVVLYNGWVAMTINEKLKINRKN